MSRSDRTPLTLAELQHRFIAALHSPEDSSKDATNALLPHIVDRAPVSARARIGIYQYAYLVRITDAVIEDFPLIQGAIGPDKLKELVHEYLRLYPSRYPTLTEVSQHFEEFLRTHAITKDHPYLPDLARFEWRKIECFYTDDLSAENWQDKLMQPDLDLASLTLTFQPHVSLFKSKWAVHLASETSPTPPQEPARILFYREDWSDQFEPLTEAEFQVLDSLLRGKTLSQSLADASTTDPAQIQAWFSRWAQWGLVRDLG